MGKLEPIFQPPVPIADIEILSPERSSMLETKTFIRKKFEIDAAQVTGSNIEEIAKWVDGEIRTDDHGQYVKVRVHRAANDRQTKAYISDWVLYAGSGFKVYTSKAFKDNFDQVSGESTLVDTDQLREEIVGVVEGDVVVPKRVAKKATKRT